MAIPNEKYYLQRVRAEECPEGDCRAIREAKRGLAIPQESHSKKKE